MSMDRASKRLRHGVVYTPRDVAKSIVAALQELGVDTKGNILEPSAGDGAFVSAIEQSSAQINSLVAIDIDKRAVRRLQNLYPKLTIIHQDFFEFANNCKAASFDLAIGNPPYIRKKNFTQRLTAKINAMGKKNSYSKSLMKNAWAAFILATEPLLKKNGTLAFVVPYELINVSYGVALQKEMSTKFECIDIFVPDEKAFKKIDQDAVLVVARKSAATKGVFIHRVHSLTKIAGGTGKQVDLGNEKKTSVDLKSFLLDDETQELIYRILNRSKSIGDYCQSRTGIVTAANQYFILSDEEVSIHGLKAWARPILKKGMYLAKGPIFSKANYQSLSKHSPSKLLDFNEYSPDSPDEDVEAYIKLGIQSGIPESYKARYRTCWYKISVVPASPLIFFKRSHAYPRLCLNKAGVLVTDTGYLVTTNSNATPEGICHSFYNSFTLLMSEISGRFYGGGVLELTPKEFRSLPIFYTEPSKKTFNSFAQSDIWDNSISLAKYGDSLLVDRHNFSEHEIKVLNRAWITLRSHRLRHGNKRIVR